LFHVVEKGEAGKIIPYCSIANRNAFADMKA
jgi:hypothetical protein